MQPDESSVAIRRHLPLFSKGADDVLVEWVATWEARVAEDREDEGKLTVVMADIELSYLARFAAAEREVPQRPAVVESGRVVSYSEFGTLVRRLAYALVHAQTGSRVLIHLPQSSEAFAAMFAVGVSGGFYATTNVAAPPERRRGTFEAFGPNIIVTNADLADEARAICPSARLITEASLGKDELTVPAEPHELAYVMFTSGTRAGPRA